MIKTISKIRLYPPPDGRQTPIVSGYRPLFDIPGYDSKTSGRIDLLTGESLAPGTTEEVQIVFLETAIKKGSLRRGTKFVFGEGSRPLGEGEILEVLS